MKIRIVKKTHLIFYQLFTIVASLPNRGTIGPAGFEIVTHSPYIPVAYYNYRLYNDGRLENSNRGRDLIKFEEDHELPNAAVVAERTRPRFKEVHFRDGVSSMIMDIKMPPHYHFRKGQNKMHNLDVNEIARQLSVTGTAASLPNELIPLTIQQKNNPKNVNYNQILNLATFFSSGRDTVDYGYSLDSKGNRVVDEELNSPFRHHDEYDGMNARSTGIATETESTEAKKIPINTESTETYKFAMETEEIELLSTTESYATEEQDEIGNRGHYPAHVVASLIGGG